MTRSVRVPKKIDPGFRVPDNQPEDTVCVRLYVPNDPLYIAAMWGSIEALTKWVSWERGGTKAKEASEVWKIAYTASRQLWEQCPGECGLMDVRQSETPCILEKRTNCDDWEQFADMRLCVPKMRFLNGVLQQDTTGEGNWVDAGDPEAPYDDRTDGAYTPAWTDPPEGEDGACLAALNAIAFARQVVTSYANLIDGGASAITGLLYWLSTITIIAAIANVIIELTADLDALINGFAGDWGDVASYDFTSDILCIIHDAYSADGSMTGAGWATIGTAMETEAEGHANAYERTAIRLASVVFFALGPVGMARIANFASIVTGDCSACGTFHHTFDFTVDEQGFEAAHQEGYPYSGVYSAGNGWRPVYGLYNDGYVNRLSVWSPLADDFTVTKTQSTYSMGGNSFLCFIVNYHDEGQGAVTVEWLTGDDTTVWEGSETADRFRTGGENSVEGQVITLTKFEVWGIGDDPFA